MRFSHIYRRGRINASVKKATYLAQRKRLLALLRDTRTKAGLTQAELASRLHRDQTFVSKYETGERRLDILELRDVCRALSVDFKDFASVLIVIPVSASIITIRSGLMGNVVEVQSQKRERGGK